MHRFFFVFIFILTECFFRVVAQTPNPTQTPISVCEQCTNRALINNLVADYGVTNINTLENALAEKLWIDKIRGEIVPVGIKEFDLMVLKATSENQMRKFLRNYSQAQLFIITTKILTPGNDEIIKNCYKTCVDFNDEMLHLYEGPEAKQFDLDILKIRLEALFDYVVIDPEYGNPTFSLDRNVRIAMGLAASVTVRVTEKNLSVVDSDGNTKIPTLFDNELIKTSDLLYRFKLNDPNKIGVLVIDFLNKDLDPYGNPSQDENCPKFYQIIFPPRFAPALESSPKL